MRDTTMTLGGVLVGLFLLLTLVAVAATDQRPNDEPWRAPGSQDVIVALPQPASWEPLTQPGPDATSIQVKVVEHACADGEPVESRVAGPGIASKPDAVVVTYGVYRAISRDCLGSTDRSAGASTVVTLELEEPLGDRQLLDGGVIPPAPPQAGRLPAADHPRYGPVEDSLYLD